MAPAGAAVASAPGKVLLTGAYLVLSRPYAGLTAAVDARFYAKVQQVQPLRQGQPSTERVAHVRILSPQLQRECHYRLTIPGLILERTTPGDDTGNPFVEKALQFAVGAAAALAIKREGSPEGVFSRLVTEGLEITLLGDNAFYSQRQQLLDNGLPLSAPSLALLPQFGSLTNQTTSVTNGHAVPEVPKTGLGSSAAMTTATVGALLHFLQAIDLRECSREPVDVVSNSEMDTPMDLEIVHRISQAAHCAAQGKVGSGFDICSATFGSQRYVRFSPSVLQPALEDREVSNFVETSTSTIYGNWDEEHTSWTLPQGLILMVGEPGRGGSSTPSMVGAVLKWRKEEGVEGERVWANLAAANQSAEEAFKRLNTLAVEQASTYKTVLDSCTFLSSREWPRVGAEVPDGIAVVDALMALQKALVCARVLLREIGINANVPIEPQEQTELLDLTMDLEGVLFSGIPGAGGFDASFAIVIGLEGQRKVESFWAARKVLSLGVQQEVQGLRIEEGFPTLNSVA